MSKTFRYGYVKAQLQRFVCEVDLSKDGELKIIGGEDIEELSALDSKFLCDVLSECAEFFTSIVINRVKGEIPIDMSWIALATNLTTIDIAKNTSIHVDELLEQIVQNDSIVNARFPYNSYNNQALNQALRNKVDITIKARNAKCIELGSVDNPVFDQLAFNDFTHTWLPYDAVHQKWKLSKLVYDEYTQSFSAPVLLSSIPLGVNLSKVEMIKASYWASIGAIKHELKHRQTDLEALISERGVLIKSIEDNPEDGAVAEFARMSSLIGNHKKQINGLETTMSHEGAKVVVKLAAQTGFDQEWFKAVDKQDISEMKLNLAKGADLHARNEYGKTARDMVAIMLASAAGAIIEDLKVVMTTLTQMQAEQDAYKKVDGGAGAAGSEDVHQPEEAKSLDLVTDETPADVAATGLDGLESPTT